MHVEVLFHNNVPVLIITILLLYYHYNLIHPYYLSNLNNYLANQPNLPLDTIFPALSSLHSYIGWSCQEFGISESMVRERRFCDFIRPVHAAGRLFT